MWLWSTTKSDDASVDRRNPGVPNLSSNSGGPGDDVVVARPMDASEVESGPKWDPEGIQDFELTNTRGDTIKKNDLLGRPWVVSFIFIRCGGPCPRVSGQMRILQDQLDALGSDARLVTITVDPDYDTPERLAEYAKTFGADPDRWIFLTGDKTEIYRMIQKSFRMPVQETVGEDRVPGFEVIHTTNVLLVNADGVVVEKYNSLNDVEMAALRRKLSGREGESPEKIDSSAAEESRDRDASPDADKPQDAKELPHTGQSKEASEASGEEAATADSNPPIIRGQSPDASATANDSNNAVQTGGADLTGNAPSWVLRLPAVNAVLNGLSTLLLLLGVWLIKHGKRQAHKRVMLSTFGVSIAFLVCYLVYHIALDYYTGSGSRAFQGTGTVRAVYLTILLTHVVLAAAVPLLAIVTIYRGLKGQFDKHRRIARITFPIWLYVSVTGVVIYLMLYQWPVSNS